MTAITTPQPSKTPRFHALDGLRGAAALLVVFVHMRVSFEFMNWANHVTGPRFVRNGFIAVDLFFMLSGLVIAANYSERIGSLPDIYRFMRLRFFRLYPLHFLMLLGFVAFEFIKLIAISGGGQTASPAFSGPQSIAALVANLFLVQAWHLFPLMGYNVLSWSISCEVGAYIGFALLAYMGLVRKRIFGPLGIVSIIACYVGLLLSPRGLDSTADWGLLRCWAAFTLGMFIWRYLPVDKMPVSRILHSSVQVFTLVALAVVMTLFNGNMLMFAMPLFFVLIATLQTGQGVIADLLETQPLQRLGRISYSVYMVHSFLLVSLTLVSTRLLHMPLSETRAPDALSALGNPWVGDVLAAGIVAVVFGVAALTFRYVEEPGRLYGKRTTVNPGSP
ncbi:MAG: acyltransferase [Gemmatimonadaceae bacterium]